jgi:NLE (NUC135) domain
LGFIELLGTSFTVYHTVLHEVALFFDDFLVPLYIIADPEHENQPFDFLIDGELIRMPLDQFLMAKGITAVCFAIPTMQFYLSSILLNGLSLPSLV